MTPTPGHASPELESFLAAHPGKDLDRDGLRLHYLDEGEGDPVVMVHGNPTWSIYYRRLVTALRSDYRVIVPDHMGCGLSDKPDDARYRYTLASRADDLEALLDQLHLDRPITLVLHDWGGMIGMVYAARHPERIGRLVVMNTAAFHMPNSKRLPWSLWISRNTRVGEWAIRGLNAFARGTAWIGCKRKRMPSSLRDAYVAPYDSWANRIAVLRFVQDIPLRPGDPCYDLVSFVESRLELFSDVPMLIAWGMKDFVFDRPFLEEWIRRFPRARVHEYPLAGHYVLEDEAESLIPAIRQFLEAHSLARAEGN